VDGNGRASEVDERTREYKRAGFSDQDYLIQVQARALYDKAKNAYGIRILKCKIQPDLVGFELWGEECNFQGLIQVLFPGDELAEWGYK